MKFLFLFLNCLILIDSCCPFLIDNLGLRSSNLPIQLSLTKRQVDSQEQETRMMRQLNINQQTPTVPLRNSVSLAYFINVGVGTPPQYQSVLLDTGSYNLMTAYINGSSYSSTYSPTNLPMTQWGCTGVKAYDVVTVGGLSVVNQLFWQATNPPKCFTGGVWGISCLYDTMEKMQEVLPNMYKQGKIPQPVFGLYLNSNYGNDTTSSITLGGVDRTHFIGEITWVPIIKDAWKASVSSMEIGSKRVVINTPNCEGVFDSGTSYMYLHANFVADIAAAIGANATYASDNVTVNEYQGSCYLLNIPENRLTFNIGDAKVTLRPMDYLSNAHDDANLCTLTFAFYPALQPGDKCGYGFGDNFLTFVYSAYDFGNRRIGFAPVYPVPNGWRN